MDTFRHNQTLLQGSTHSSLRDPTSSVGQTPLEEASSCSLILLLLMPHIAHRYDVSLVFESVDFCGHEAEGGCSHRRLITFRSMSSDREGPCCKPGPTFISIQNFLVKIREFLNSLPVLQSNKATSDNDVIVTSGYIWIHRCYIWHRWDDFLHLRAQSGHGPRSCSRAATWRRRNSLPCATPQRRHWVMLDEKRESTTLGCSNNFVLLRQLFDPLI